jgi:hypothetical protein
LASLFFKAMTVPALAEITTTLAVRIIRTHG